MATTAHAGRRSRETWRRARAAGSWRPRRRWLMPLSRIGAGGSARGAAHESVARVDAPWERHVRVSGEVGCASVLLAVLSTAAPAVYAQSVGGAEKARP